MNKRLFLVWITGISALTFMYICMIAALINLANKEPEIHYNLLGVRVFNAAGSAWDQTVVRILVLKDGKFYVEEIPCYSEEEVLQVLEAIE